MVSEVLPSFSGPHVRLVPVRRDAGYTQTDQKETGNRNLVLATLLTKLIVVHNVLLLLRKTAFLSE